MKQAKINNAPPIDRALVERAQAGDQAAYTELYELTSPQIYRSIHAMVRDEDLAWDVQQETYLRAWKSLDKLRDPEAILPWLRRIAVNVTATELAQRKELTFTELAGEEGREPVLPDLRAENQPELALDRKEVSRQVREIVSGLPPEQQAVIGMFYFEEVPIREIAEILQVTPGTVKTQLHRGRKRVEQSVLDLQKRGVSLFGLAPVSYLMALLRRLEPEPGKNRKALGTVLERAPAGTVTVTAVTAGQALLHSVWTRILALAAAAALLVGGKYAYDAVKKGPEPEIGDYRPPVVETVLADRDREPTPTRRGPLDKLLDLLPDDVKPTRRPVDPQEPSEENPPEPSEEEPPEPSEEEPPAPSEEEPPEPSAQNPAAPALNQPDPNAPAPNEPPPSAPANPGGETPQPSEPNASEPSEPAPSQPAEPSPSEEPTDSPDNEPKVLLSGSCGSRLTWNYMSNNTLMITGTGDMSSVQYEFAGYQNSVFYSQEEIRQNTQSVIVAEGVTSLSNYAFNSFVNLRSVSLPKSLTAIGAEAFNDCVNLQSVTIPPQVRTIETSTFAYCQSLKSVTIPANVTSIIGNPFEGCTSLKSILVDPGNSVFSSDSKGVLYNKAMTKLLICPGKALSCSIPTDVTEIEASAFSNCAKLLSVSIPDSVTEIGSYAFDFCSSLTSVSLPESLRTISYGMFSGCSELKLVTIPASVETIASFSFSGCTSLNSVVIPEGASIGMYAFDHCTNLRTVTIPESVSDIGQSAFSGCSSLTIHGAAGSYAEQYAIEYGIPFEVDP